MKYPGLFCSALLLPILFTGCKPGAASERAETTDGSAIKYDTAPAPSATGSVNGTVSFSGKAPDRVPIDMSQDPACSLSGAANMSEQVVVNHGSLQNVFVYVKGAPRLAPSAQPVVVDQKGCRFIPHVVAVAAGGTVEFRNSDPTMHNVHSMAVQAGNHSVDISQGPGSRPQQVKFTDAENLVPVRCNNHPWMNAFVDVSPNTYFAVTGENGKFSIPGLPAGNYTLVFVHEKLGEQSVPVTIKAGASTPANVSYPAH